MRDANGAGLCVYKFGISADPITRRPYYVADNFTVFIILHVSRVLDAVSWGESFLIYEFKRMGIGSCRNVRSGGDGSLGLKTGVPNQLFYLYMAAARADGRRPIRG